MCDSVDEAGGNNEHQAEQVFPLPRPPALPANSASTVPSAFDFSAAHHQPSPATKNENGKPDEKEAQLGRECTAFVEDARGAKDEESEDTQGWESAHGVMEHIMQVR